MTSILISGCRACLLYTSPEVKEQVEKLYRNLAAQDIDGKRFVIEHIKRPIKQYVVGLNPVSYTHLMAEGKFLKVGTSDVIADPVKIIDQAIEIIKATGGAVDAPKAEAKARCV